MKKPIRFTVLSTLALCACDADEPVSIMETSACNGVEIARVEITRTAGAPNIASTGTFMSTGQLCVEVTAGKGDKKTAPSSAIVSLSNYGTIVGPSEFKNHGWTRSFLVSASDYGSRELTIDLASAPGSYVQAVVYEQGLNVEDVPEGSTPMVIYPEEAGRLQLDEASLQWGPRTVSEPLLIWCSESQDGPELAIECGPSTQFEQALTVSLPVSDTMMADTLATLDTEGKAPTIVWDGEPRATITEVTTGRAYAAIEHFSGGTVQRLEYVTEANKGQITQWAQNFVEDYPHQTLEYPIFVSAAEVGKDEYRKYIIPKRPEVSLDINLQTRTGDADLFTNYTSLGNTSRQSNQYQSINLGWQRDAVSVPVAKAGLYFAAVQGYEAGTSYALLIKPVDDAKESDQYGKWTVVLDAGHGLDEAQLESFGEATCEGAYDDQNAAYERTLNSKIIYAARAELQKLAIDPLPDGRVEVVTYDGTILPWAAATDGVSPLQHRWRETQLEYGCVGYRGLLMRRWVKETQRIPAQTLALQVHNDSVPLGSVALEAAFGDGLGSEGASWGFEGNDAAWLTRMREAMDPGMYQRWNGTLSVGAANMAFVRGASGYTMCNGNGLMLEKDCNEASINSRPGTYGDGLRSAALLEVAHYVASSATEGDVRFLYADPEDQYLISDEMFLAQTGQMIAFEAQRYLLAKIHPDY